MATIKQVAEQAGVSTATVSYVLNGTGSITDATRQRVLAAIAELNYQPNYAARTMRRRSRTLGLVLPALSSRLTDPLLSQVLSGLSEACASHGYCVLLATADASQAETVLAEQLVRSGRVDGVILLDIQADDERIGYLHDRAIPFVCAGPPPVDITCHAVMLDYQDGAARAIRHLLALGHCRIGVILPPSDLAASEPCYQGYAAALHAAGLVFDPSLAIEAGRTQADGVTAMQELLDLPDPPTAVLACSDELAFGAMHALYAVGLQVGRDLSLVGFDDAPMAAHTNPPLTTLHAPHRDVGLHLAQLLIEAIEQPVIAPRHILLPVHLIIRKSTGSVL